MHPKTALVFPAPKPLQACVIIANSNSFSLTHPSLILISARKKCGWGNLYIHTKHTNPRTLGTTFSWFDWHMRLFHFIYRQEHLRRLYDGKGDMFSHTIKGLTRFDAERDLDLLKVECNIYYIILLIYIFDLIWSRFF